MFQNWLQQSFCGFPVGLQEMKWSKESIIVEIGCRHLEAYLECASIAYRIMKVRRFFKGFCDFPVKMLTQSWALKSKTLTQ